MIDARDFKTHISFYRYMILYLLSIAGIVSGFICLTLAIASGLYYLSELVEEHAELTKRTLYRTICTIMVVLVLLWLGEGFPFWHTLYAVCLNGLYLKTLLKFPYLRIDSADFIALGVLTFVNHFLWFNYFNGLLQGRDYSSRIAPTFSEISSFFGICVWLVPFALFISLSAGENLLPSSNGDIDASKVDRVTLDSSEFTPTTFTRKSKGLIKEVILRVRDYIFPEKGSII